MNSGKLEVVIDNKAMTTTATLKIAYSFAGQALGINFAGTGEGTYAGPEL